MKSKLINGIVAAMMILTVLAGCGKTEDTEAVKNEAVSETAQSDVSENQDGESETEENNETTEIVKKEEAAEPEEEEEAAEPEEELSETETNLVDFSQTEIGDIVTLGRKHLDEDYSTLEDLEWIVLDKQDDQLLLQCTQNILNMGHNARSWKDSRIREWLNTYFYYECFNEDERSLMVLHKSDDLEATEDNIFCLSTEEYDKYGSEEFFQINKEYTNTDYECHAPSGGGATSSSKVWTRSFGINEKSGTGAMYFNTFGDGTDQYGVSNGVCPAMWIDASKTYEIKEETSSLDLSCDEIAVGKTFTFGTYYQDLDFSNGKEPIEWQILDIQDDRVIAISTKGLDWDRVNDSESRWQKWIDNMFYYVAFNETDRNYILNEKIKGEGYSYVYFLTKDMQNYYSINSQAGNYEDTDYCKICKEMSDCGFLPTVSTLEERDALYSDTLAKDGVGRGLRPCISVDIKAFSGGDEAASYAQYGIGDTITMGTYEQDNNLENGSEDIEWIVTKAQQGKVLLVSKYVLDQQVYGIKNGTNDIQNQWIDSTLRTWLNDEFYQSAFTDQEKNKIIPTLTSSRDSLNDNVFIISRDEMLELGLGAAETTTYARSRGVFGLYENGNAGKEGLYWLRPTDGLTVVSHPAEVLVQTYVVGSSDVVWTDIDNAEVGVRPAMWISTQ